MKRSRGRKMRFGRYRNAFLCRAQNTNLASPFQCQNFGLTLRVNCDAGFVGVVNFVWHQVMLISRYFQHIRKSAQVVNVVSLHVGLKVVKPVNPSHTVVISERLRTTVCFGKLVSQTFYLFLGETDW